MIKKNS